MELQTCSHCGVCVVPTSEGMCPSCRQSFQPVVDVAIVPESPSAAIDEPVLATPVDEVSGARAPAKLLVPAILLTLCAVLGIVNCVYVMVTPERPIEKVFDDPELQAEAEYGRDVAGMARSPLVLVVYLIMLAGSAAMIKREYWGLALAASIFAMLPCSAVFLLSLPVGVWSIVILSLPKVKAGFR